jgi:hypothetical protein
MKPLDFVTTEAGNIGMITEVSTTQGVHTACIAFLKGFEGEKNAWWSEDEIYVVDSLPDLLARKLCHPMGNGSLQPFKLNK